MSICRCAPRGAVYAAAPNLLARELAPGAVSKLDHDDGAAAAVSTDSDHPTGGR